MSSLAQIIELFSVIVIVVSIPGTIYFIVRIIANRGRWNGEQYGEQDRKNIYHNNPEKSTPPQKKKSRS